MAAEIKPVASRVPFSNEKIVLRSKIDIPGHDIKGAVLLPENVIVISISDDKSVRVWQRRDSGQYWPSVCHFLPSMPTRIEFTHSTWQLFVSLENGTVTEFFVARDGNSVQQKRDYLAHQGYISGIFFVQENKWIISCGKDKFVTYHCTQSGHRLGGHQCSAPCTALVYDALTQHVFVGDYSGDISMLKLENNGPRFITTLKGHSGSVQSLAWNSLSKHLFSGSYDQVIIVWDIGGGKGTVYELQGHMNKVSSLIYSHKNKVLISAGEDSSVVFWNMDTKRQEAPSWAESDVCQYCSRPFYWNLRAMMDQKQIGIRQHHCRKCGRAVCDNCSNKKSVLPLMGFEFPVRVCDKCNSSLGPDDHRSLAKFQDVKHSVVSMSLDEKVPLLLTVGNDRVIKIWEVSSALNLK